MLLSCGFVLANDDVCVTFDGLCVNPKEELDLVNFGCLNNAGAGCLRGLATEDCDLCKEGNAWFWSFPPNGTRTRLVCCCG